MLRISNGAFIPTDTDCDQPLECPVGANVDTCASASTPGSSSTKAPKSVGRVTRLTDFGAFVELEPGVEALAHVSTFAPTGHSKGWSQSVSVGMTAPFEILSIDTEKKRIGVALAQEGSQEAVAARQAEELREYTERAEAAPQAFGSLAEKLRG